MPHLTEALRMNPGNERLRIALEELRVRARGTEQDLSNHENEFGTMGE